MTEGQSESASAPERVSGLIINSDDVGWEYGVLVDINCWGLLRRRRSFKKKHLRKISTEANIARRYTPKLPSRELRHSDMP
jgi:hypothetical protein